MLLPDHEIKRYLGLGRIIIDPFEDWMIQPASVDIQIGNEFMWYHISSPHTRNIDLDPFEKLHEEDVVRVQGPGPFRLSPGDFCLATTLQRITIDPGIAARIEGKSTLGRRGIIVHSTAGFIDPGFSGQLTLEMANLSHRPILLKVGMPIAQLSFTLLTAPAARPYGHGDLGSHYQGQAGVTGPEPLHRYKEAT